jgi:hypothetical protein
MALPPRRPPPPPAPRARLATSAGASGKVAGTAGAAQHVDRFRKDLLRAALVPHALPGPVYAPFCGEGDLAVSCYPGRRIYGADLDDARVATAQARLPGSVFRVADCDGWPFPDATAPFAIADFDAYANPYPSLAAFWAEAPKLDRLVLFGTDGLRQGLSRRNMTAVLPSGAMTPATIAEARRQFNTWWAGVVLPYLRTALAPWRITTSRFYIRGRGQLYWGVEVTRG